MKILSKLDNTGMIDEVTDKRFVTDAEKSTWNNKADTDTITTINGKTGAISKADIVALGIPSQDTNTTYSEISTAEIDAGTASTGRTITGRRVKYLLDKTSGMISAAIGALTKSSVGLGNVDNTSDASKPISTATQAALNGKVNNSQVLTNVPSGAKFTDTLTTINGKTGAITKADITALGIPAQDTVVDISGKADKTYVDNKVKTDVPVGAKFTDTVYSHPASHPASMITDLPTGKKAARFVVGTSTAGWTAADCDYLCDGSADETEINAAINALPATGGEIVILDGTYNITAKIDVTKDNVSIRGNANSTILKRMYDTTAAEGLITLTNRSGCKIANLQVDGNKTSYTDMNNASLLLYNSNNNTVTGNTCNNSGVGILLLDSSSNTVTGNTCNNNSDSGIYLLYSNNNIVTGNTCKDNMSGIYLTYSNNNTVTGNTFIRGTGLATDYAPDHHTIRLDGNNYNLISNNNCMGRAVTSGAGTGNTIIDNKWSSSSGRILESYSEKLVTLLGTVTTIDLLLGNVFTHTLSGNTRYIISNAVNGQAHSFTLIINMGSIVRTLTFPSSVKWQGGEIPDLTTANKTYVLTFMTVDGGTTWLGMFGGEF